MHVVTIVGVVSLMGCGRVAFDPLAEDAPRDGAFACPATYTEMNGGCYRFVLNTNELAWVDAEAACEGDTPGAHLLVIDDAAELDLVVSAISTITDAWIGASDRVTEGMYLRVTGGPAFTPWASGEPGGDDCLQVLAAGGIGDRGCEMTNDYLCELDGRAPDPTAF